VAYLRKLSTHYDHPNGSAIVNCQELQQLVKYCQVDVGFHNDFSGETDLSNSPAFWVGKLWDLLMSWVPQRPFR
jgi:hypothetical protein